MRPGLPQVVRRRLDPDERYGLRLTVFGLAIVLVAVPFSTLLYQVLARGSLTELDGSVADDLNHAVHDVPVLVNVLEAVTWLGTPVWLVAVVGAAAAFAWWRGRRRLAVFLVVTALGGGAISSLVKILVDRPRPVVDHPIITAFGKSFPSGHAMSSTVCYGAVLLAFLPVVRRRLRTVAVAVTSVLILAIGSSRVLLGVHFLTDVLGGFVLGAAWLALAVAAFEVWRVEEGRPASDPLHEGLEPEAGPALRGEQSERDAPTAPT